MFLLLSLLTQSDNLLTKTLLMKPSGYILLLLLCGRFLLGAQNLPTEAALQHLRQQAPAWGLTQADIADLHLQSWTGDPDKGHYVLYFIQRHQGVEIYNAIVNLTMKNNEVLFVGNRLVSQVASRIQGGTAPALTAEQAVAAGLVALGGSAEQPAIIEKRESDLAMIFSAVSQTHTAIPARWRYQLMPDGALKLAWDIGLDYKGGNDFWSLRIDASNGQELDRNSWTTHCQIDKNRYARGHVHNHTCLHESSVTQQAPAPERTMTDGASYRVFKWPAESPAHGEHLVVTEPSHPGASPYGWHDTNGVAGPEFTTTRGNNVRAYSDKDGNNSPDGATPEGGASLTFDFPYNPTAEPIGNEAAATVNLFYANNMIHDFAFVHGFDELSANFQVKNYTNLGLANDPVLAEALDAMNAAQPSVNNANFATPPDGLSGRMQMFIWTSVITELVHVNAPAALAGLSFEAGTAEFGAPITGVPITGLLEIADDGSTSPTLGCNELNNTLDGKIAVIDRGICNFSAKVFNAQQKGAVAVMICNFGEDILNMAAGTSAAQVTIPSVFLPASSCNLLKQFINQGIEVSLFLEDGTIVPEAVDGDFDNGIISHEFAHGISNRLTGGGSNTGCLANAEQMGEGWSDFFSLVASVRPGDTPETPRGIGTFVQRQENNGTGIRRYRYSTDMTVNPLTLGFIPQNTGVHQIGEIWVSALWDLYWKMVEVHGYNEDWFSPDGGNNMAVRLVMQGMKSQPCSPGFIDGRDAIIAADELLYNGENKCLIWDVFARRGMGWGASQGSNLIASDVTEDFNTYPYCVKQLKMEKLATADVLPGEEFEVTLHVFNHADVAYDNVQIKDFIPAEATYVSHTAGPAPTVNGNEVVYNLGTVNPLDSLTFKFKLKSHPDTVSVSIFYDDFEQGEISWLYESFGVISNPWGQIDINAFSGSVSFGVASLDTSSDERLRFTDPKFISGTFPALRFKQVYGTEYGGDGGFLEIKPASANWFYLKDNFLRGDYPRQLQYGTFAIPDMKAWTGERTTHEDVLVDLRTWNNNPVNVQWRFGTDGNTSSGIGWFIDDVELLDLRYYNSEACLTADGIDPICKEAPHYGTVVASTGQLGTNAEDVKTPLLARVQPNPASDKLVVTLGQFEGAASLALYSVDGRLAHDFGATPGLGSLELRIDHLPAGTYYLRAINRNQVQSVPVLIQR
jgi:uncharacterized repeat protein (TIGR01451 family)